MVYHEIRKVNGKKQNYLVYNKREGEKWVKKSRFIGLGDISKKKIFELKKEFEMDLKVNKEYVYLNEEQVKKIEKLSEEYQSKIGESDEEEFKKFEESFLQN